MGFPPHHRFPHKEPEKPRVTPPSPGLLFYPAYFCTNCGRPRIGLSEPRRDAAQADRSVRIPGALALLRVARDERLTFRA